MNLMINLTCQSANQLTSLFTSKHLVYTVVYSGPTYLAGKWDKRVSGIGRHGRMLTQTWTILKHTSHLHNT